MSTLSSDPPPGQPSVTVSSTTATTISLSWSVPSGSVVDSYEVVWERNGIRNSTTITDGSTSYTITGLEEGSSYIITVNATNAAGSAASDPVSKILRAGILFHDCTEVWLLELLAYVDVNSSIITQWKMTLLLLAQWWEWSLL